MNGPGPQHALKLEDFQRAQHDPEFRAFLTHQYGIGEGDLPPLADAPDFADVTGGSSAAKPKGDGSGSGYDRLASLGTMLTHPEGLARSAMQGVTLGLADEAGALGQAAGESLRHTITGRTPADLVNPPPSFGDRYRQLQGEEQAKLDQFAAEHPVANLGAQVAGSLLPVAGAASVARSAPGVVRSLAGRMLAGAGEGAALGGIHGAAQAHPGERVGGAALGTAGGAVVGGLAPAAVDASGAAIRGLKSMGTRGAVPSLATGAPANPAVGTDTRALDLILSRIEQGKQSVGDVATMAGEYGGKPFTVADASDPLRRLAETVAQTPTKGASQLVDFATTRAEGFTPRALEDVTATLGVQRPNVVTAVKQRMVQRAQEAAPLYAAAHAAPPVPVTPELAAVLDDPTAKVAFAKGQAIARRFAAAGQGEVLPGLYGKDGKLAVGEIPVQTLDYIKQGLDDLLQSKPAFGSGGTGARTYASRVALKSQLTDLVDQHFTVIGAVDQNGVPLWKAARQAFAGPSAEIRALASGKKAWSMLPEEITATLQGLGTEGERDMFRAGAIRSMDPQLRILMGGGASPGSVVARGMVSDKARALFGNEANFAAYQKLMGQERTLAKLYPSVAGGSQTARRLLGAQDVGQAAEAAGDVVMGRPVSAAQRLLGDMGRGLYRRAIGVTPAVADALGPALTATGSDRDQLIRALIQREMARRTQQQAGRFAGRVGASAAGGAAGRP